MIRVAIALLAASAGLAAPGVKAKGPALYYPVREGTKLVYEAGTEHGTEERTVTVARVEDKGGAFRVSVTRDGKDAGTTAVEVSGAGVFRVAGGEGEGLLPLLKLPAKPGDSWLTEMDLGGGRVVAVVFRIANEEEVEVPAGKFKAVRVEMSGLGDGGCPVPPTVCWYAPGVGVVKRTATGGAPETTVLKSFTPGK